MKFYLNGAPDGSATLERYAEAVTDADGGFTLAFELPATWPDGTSIEVETLVVTVSTEDGASLATAILRYLLAAITE